MERSSKLEKRFVLLDRDGTLIAEKHYLRDPDQVELLPGAVEGLRLLRENGFGLILVTNQSGIGRGMFSVEDLCLVHARLEGMLRDKGVWLDAIYTCPHAPEEHCACRKPQPKLAFDAARDFGFELKTAWMVGDKAADVELATNCGARSVLVRTGYGRETEAAGVTADLVVDDLATASRHLSHQELS